MHLYPPTWIIVILYSLASPSHTYSHFKEYKILLLDSSLSPKNPTTLRSLHWLPIHHRITLKVLILTYKILNGQAPKYLSDLLFLRSSSSLRPLRSASTLQLTPGPRTKTRYGDRSFSVIAPLLWNNLPSHIHNSNSLDLFKTLLKTHLFNT